MAHDAPASICSMETNAQHSSNDPGDHSSDGLVRAGERLHIHDPSIGENEQWYINDHTFIEGPDGRWHLFGITHPEPADALDETFFAHLSADSLTQVQWQKHDPVMHADPAFGETHVWAPFVLHTEGKYWMFYAGGTPDHEAYQMSLATSTDLFHWTRHPTPLFTDGFDGRDPMVLRVGDEWVLYYAANSTPAGGHFQVAYRTSTDLVNWGEKQVAFQHPTSGTYGGPTESPFVVEHGGWYYLFVCGESHYTDTPVYRSRDPLHFEYSQRIGQVDAHAAEVAQDSGGRYWVSGAGWGMGGVYLRPLQFPTS